MKHSPPCTIYVKTDSYIFNFSVTGYLVTCVNDIKILLIHLLSAKETPNIHFSGKIGLLVSLIEPTIEYIMKFIFEDASQVSNIIWIIMLMVKLVTFISLRIPMQYGSKYIISVLRSTLVFTLF